MDHDTDGDGAINLSTSQRPSASTTPNGDVTTPYSQDQQDNDQVLVPSFIPTNNRYDEKPFRFMKIPRPP